MEFVLASRPWLRNVVTVWATAMVAGLLGTFAMRGLDLLGPTAPLVVRVLFPVGAVWVVWLQRQLDAILPAGGTRVRVGRRAE